MSWAIGWDHEHKRDTEKWIRHKATDPSWEEWRQEQLKNATDPNKCVICGYEHNQDYAKEDLWVTGGGVGVTDEGQPIHWFEGIYTCPRCGFEIEVEDSD